MAGWVALSRVDRVAVREKVPIVGRGSLCMTGHRSTTHCDSPCTGAAFTIGGNLSLDTGVVWLHSALCDVTWYNLKC